MDGLSPIRTPDGEICTCFCTVMARGGPSSRTKFNTVPFHRFSADSLPVETITALTLIDVSQFTGCVLGLCR